MKKIEQQSINTISIKPKDKMQHSYILVDKRFLNLNDSVKFKLFTHEGPTQMSLFLQSDTIIDKQQQQRIRRIEQLYVQDSDRFQYDNFLEEHLQNILKNHSLSMDEKTDLIYSSSTELTNSLYSNPEALENAKRSENIVTPILESVLHNENTITSYIKIIEYDYYTHTHSLNVSIYAICLGMELGYDKNALKDLGRAALLHDLGKSKVKQSIVNKNGSLSEEEFMAIKMHPALGYEIAMSIGIDNKKILDAIRHHHEKLDGKGYPDHLKGREISIFARIIGVCDIFDALTTKRSYKDAMNSFEALSLMKTEMASHIDIKILQTFIYMLHK